MRKRYDSDNHSEDYQAYENLVKETIDYESLEVTHHDDMRQVDEIVNLIVETVMCKNDKILIASNCIRITGEEKISDADLFTYRVCLTLYEW